MATQWRHRLKRHIVVNREMFKITKKNEACDQNETHWI